MRRLRLIPAKTQIDFIGKHRLLFMLLGALVISSMVVLGVRGLNLGIDFLGGVLMEIQTKQPLEIADLRSELAQLELGEVALQEFGGPDDLLIRIQRQPGGDAQQQAAIQAVKTLLDDRVLEYRRTETVGPTIGAELQQAALYAIFSAIIAILIYIWFRFEWQFGIGAVLALTHDMLTTMGLFAILQLEFNLATVAALLTIAGYSINDTVVMYDRVRENIRKYRKMPLEDLFNLSINQTLSRTVTTSVTTMLALLALLIFGGDVIRDFSIALAWGVIIGTVSSVALAVPLLLYLRPDRGNETPDAPESRQPESRQAES